MEYTAMHCQFRAGSLLWRAFGDEITNALSNSTVMIWRFLEMDQVYTYDEKYYILGEHMSPNPLSTVIRERFPKIGDVMASRICGASSNALTMNQNDCRSICVLLFYLRYVTIQNSALAVTVLDHIEDAFPEVYRCLDIHSGGQLAAAHLCLEERSDVSW